MKPAAAALALAGAVLGGPSRAQMLDPPVAIVVERGGRYVQQFEQEFSAVVCEERQRQTLVRPDGTVHKRRDLGSDFLLVKIGSTLRVFRDVIDVDGKPVRDRQDRLRKLFLEAPKTALEQTKAIVKESARYNIGVSRTVASPLTPLRILEPLVAAGFHFTLAGGLLTFEEFRSPSIIRHRTGAADHDLLSRGSFTIDTDSGRVRGAELTASGPPSAFAVSLVARYDDDRAVKILVPVEMQERYWRPDKPNDDHLKVSSSYSNFRRFQVTVDEQIKVPEMIARVATARSPPWAEDNARNASAVRRGGTVTLTGISPLRLRR